MPIALYARAARKQWHIVLAFSALGAALLSATAFTTPTLYRCNLRLMVGFASTSMPAPSTSAEVAAQLNVEQRLIDTRVRTYTQRANSGPVVQAVIATLRLPYSPDELANKIMASTPLNTTFIDISVVDTDPRRAAQIGDDVVGQLAVMAQRETFHQHAPIRGMRVEEPPSVPNQPIRSWWQLHLVAGALGGAAIGVGLATLRLQLATRRSPAHRR